jgi:DNA-binding Lrp family transcriptional regulator
MEKDIISKFYPLIDYSKLNLLQFRVYFKVNYITEGKLKELINFLEKEEQTGWTASCGGSYDLICTFFAFNPSSFNKKLKEIIEEFPDLIKNYDILTTIVIRNFGRKFLSKTNENPKQIILGGDREPEEIDEKDRVILEILDKNARETSVKIGNKIGVNYKTVLNRIKELEKREIIKGFGQILNLTNANYHSNLLMIRYHNISSKLEDKLIKYLHVHPNIISAVKTIGKWDVEIEIETLDEEDLRKIEIEIRHNFALLIHEIESIPLYQTHTKTFLPNIFLSSNKDYPPSSKT